MKYAAHSSAFAAGFYWVNHGSTRNSGIILCNWGKKTEFISNDPVNYFWKEFFCAIIKVTILFSFSSSNQHTNDPPSMSFYWKPSHPSAQQYYHKYCNNIISLFTQKWFYTQYNSGPETRIWWVLLLAWSTSAKSAAWCPPAEVWCMREITNIPADKCNLFLYHILTPTAGRITNIGHSVLSSMNKCI